MRAYWVGVLTTPVVIGVLLGLRAVIRALVAWWPDRPPLVIEDSRFRQANAAAILTARRVASVSLPGGTVLLWRTNVPWALIAAQDIEFAIRTAKSKHRPAPSGEAAEPTTTDRGE